MVNESKKAEMAKRNRVSRDLLMMFSYFGGRKRYKTVVAYYSIPYFKVRRRNNWKRNP